MDALIANSDGVITTSSSTVLKSVISGEYVVGLTYENIVEMQITQNGADNIRLVYPKEGNTACASAEYHQARSIENCARGTNGSITYGNYPSDSELGVKAIDWEWLGAQKTALLEKWTEHWAEYAG